MIRIKGVLRFPLHKLESNIVQALWGGGVVRGHSKNFMFQPLKLVSSETWLQNLLFVLRRDE